MIAIPARIEIRHQVENLVPVQRVEHAGIIDAFDGSMESSRLRLTLTSLFGSSMSVLTMMLSLLRFTTRPTTCRPSVVVTLSACVEDGRI